MVHINKDGTLCDSPKVWAPPPDRHFRLDVDETVNEQLNIYGVAGVIQNHDGNMVLSFGQRIMQPVSVVHAELLALNEGLKLVCEKGFSVLIYSLTHR